MRRGIVAAALVVFVGCAGTAESDLQDASRTKAKSTEVATPAPAAPGNEADADAVVNNHASTPATDNNAPQNETDADATVSHDGSTQPNRSAPPNEGDADASVDNYGSTAPPERTSSPT
jgi:hypothetical protein